MNTVDVKAIRQKMGMSQAEFALKFALALRTLQDWEQGRRTPDRSVRAYLTVIAREPQAVSRALGLQHADAELIARRTG